MENSEKIILDLCGGSGSWSRPYQEAGYDVKLITLPDHDVCTWHVPRICLQFHLRYIEKIFLWHSGKIHLY